MKVVLTGDAGYIGTLVKNALENSPNIELKCFDMARDTKVTTEQISFQKNNKADVLIHLAALTSVVESHSQGFRYYENNCYQYHEFLENNNNSFGHIIYASSYAVYDEECNVNPLSVYGSTKLEGEFITRRYTERVGAKHHIMRFANPVGVNDLHNSSHIKRLIKEDPNVFWLLAKLKEYGGKLQIHDIPGMTRDFYPVWWIVDCIMQIINEPDSSSEIVNVGSQDQTEVIPFLVESCEMYDIPYEFIAPPPGVDAGGNPDGAFFKPTEDFNKKLFCEFELLKYITAVKELT